MSPRTPPGQTRRRVLAFVQKRLLEGRPPTVREVQEAFSFRAVQSAREHLEALVAEGKLAKESGRARGYRLPDQVARPGPVVSVPVLGRVQAGDLTTALEEPEGYVAVATSDPTSRTELLALRVRGPSMTGAGILDDDIVIVRRQSSADSGDIVVAIVGDEATVKTFRQRRGRVELHPAHPDFEPIVPERGELFLLGKVIEVRRYLDGPGPILEAGSVA